MNSENQVQESVSMSLLWSIFRENKMLISIWTIVGFLLSLLVTFVFIAPKYSASVDLLVNQKPTDSQAMYTAQQADLQAINTYKDVINKDVVLRPVLKEIQHSDNFKGSFEDLQDMVSVKNQPNSQVISVEVTDDNAYRAADTANTIGKVFTQKIKKMMKVDNVTIVTRAKPDVKPVSPNKKLCAVIGVVVGFLVGFLISIAREIFDKTVKDDSYLTDELKLVNLGKVYHMDNAKIKYQAVKVVNNKHTKDNDGLHRRRV